MTVTVRPARENHQPLSGLWRFEQGQRQLSPMAQLFIKSAREIAKSLVVKSW
jgi:hypothetical protein